jgi:hypothetical protein
MTETTTRRRALHLWALATVAVAQPLLAVLGRNAEFFVASRAGAADIVAFLAVLLIVPPAVLLVVEAAAGLAGPRARSVAHLALVAALLTLTGLAAVGHAWHGPPLAVVAIAVGLGLTATILYARLAAVRTMTSLLAVVVLVVPLHFLFRSEAARIVFPPKPAGIAHEVSASTPVVIVVFDELPLVSLLDNSLTIDAGRYPNFAALAATAHFFRNATSVSESTVHAMPAIFTGRRSRFDLLPTAADHPESLFTWLSASYRIEAREPVTSLCPLSTCGRADDRGRVERLRALAVDAAVVLGHVLAPPAVAARYLPRIDQGWRGFVAGSGAAGSLEARAAQEEDGSRLGVAFTADRRAFYALHFMLPHVPWRYLPSGHVYPRAQDVPGLGPLEQWSTDGAAIATSRSRHLLQLGYADRVLGQVMERVRAAGIFDEALVVVVADHGCTFVPGESRRRLTSSTWPDILRVPLVVKLPHQRRGSIDDRPVQTLDIAPTVAQVLGVTLPAALDGRSLLDPGVRAARARFAMNERGERIVPAADLSGLREAVAAKVAQFGEGADLAPLFGRGRFAGFVGRPVTALSVSASQTLVADLEGDEQFAAVDPSRRLVPANLAGSVSGADLPTDDPAIAIAVNGVVRAVTPLIRAGQGGRFEAIVPASSFTAGANDVAVLVVSGSRDRPLAFATMAVPSGYALVRDRQGERIQAAGQAVAIVHDAVRGTVDAGLRRDMPGSLTLIGWVADVANETPPSVLVFADGRLVATAAPTADRPDVAAVLGLASATRSGFAVRVPAGDIDGARAMRVFGLSAAGAATELSYAPDYPYRHELGYRIVSRFGRELLRSPDGERVSIGAPLLTGYVDGWSHDGTVGILTVRGWAADREHGRPPLLLLFADDRAVAAQTANVPRPDVARALNDRRVVVSGFALPVHEESIVAARRARLFAVSAAGTAMELTPPGGESLVRLLGRGP